MDEPGYEDRRLAFGAWAGDYERFRPGYPEESLRWMVGGEPPARVVDLGAGTGRVAVRLAALGYDVLAVEPDDQMRAVAERALPGRTVAGTAEAVPVSDGSYDAVLAGQAWHWFDPERALPEVARVLRPGGRVGIVWNMRDDVDGWMSALTDITGSMASVRSEAHAEPPELGPLFGPVEVRDVRHEQEMDVDGLVGLAGSWSYVALRPDRDEVLAAVRHLAEAHPDLAGRTRFPVPYIARAYRATRP